MVFHLEEGPEIIISIAVVLRQSLFLGPGYKTFLYEHRAQSFLLARKIKSITINTPPNPAAQHAITRSKMCSRRLVIEEIGVGAEAVKLFSSQCPLTPTLIGFHRTNQPPTRIPRQEN